ncbi:unnamed protein product [Tuber melanosporum]|uniref:(Perigord truffle) hypothetical protein n=1 Tax=Tuber melanosporum (strain Mel28) TaxID=656061 RepID=D5GB86_TUBMM|nr:uncharacterized protein GSTUM_00003789001 [Tuber melanosporum]CAZ81779.1 unnamed protein product [Tuber melanosporum]
MTGRTPKANKASGSPTLTSSEEEAIRVFTREG